MKSFISILLVAFSFYSCTDSLSDNISQNCGDITNVAYESFKYCGQLKENPKQPVYVIVNSAEEMGKQFTTCENFDVALPDFTQKMILGLVAGPKPTAGYVIKIQSVREDNCQIVVEYFEKEPSKDDVVATVITYPSDYIVLPKSTKPILFIKSNEIVDYAVVGNYVANGSTSQCVGNCNTFYRIENYKLLQYLNANSFPTDFNQLNYKALIFKDDYAGFLLKIPSEIKNLKGQSKTYGTPGADNHNGIYLELSQGGVVTKIFLDTENTPDQTESIIAFKKILQDKIVELKTKS